MITEHSDECGITDAFLVRAQGNRPAVPFDQAHRDEYGD